MFKTAFELDQRWIIDLAGDRAEHVCQSQSLNVFIPADVHKKTLHDIHWRAWKQGVKTLYYCRSKSIQRAEAVSHKQEVTAIDAVGAGTGAVARWDRPAARGAGQRTRGTSPETTTITRNASRVSSTRPVWAVSNLAAGAFKAPVAAKGAE